MTIREFYEFVGGNYDEVIERLLKEERVVKYLGMFRADPSYNEIFSAAEAQDWMRLFRAGHTMKGVCYSLGLNPLGDAAGAICESVRPGVAPRTELAPLLEALKDRYLKDIEGIEACLSLQ